VRSPAPSRRGLESAPALKTTHPSASRWIGALIRMTAPHPAMTRILEVIERLQDRPFRTNFVLLGEPGTGKEGLARALGHLASPGGPLIRYDVVGFPEEDALEALCGHGRRPGLAEAADGGTLLVEEAAGLGPRVQAALLRLLKAGRCERRGERAAALDDDGAARPGGGGGGGAGRSGSRLDVNVIAMSDRDLGAEVAAGRFRHDLYYRLARVVLWLPPLRERVEDLGPAAIWMGNRILRAAGLALELMPPEELRRATKEEQARAVVLDPAAVRALAAHTWPGNFRELEAVLERALLLFRTGDRVGAEEIAAALGEQRP
jgi:DNA-binding NtrC family response regulator